ncbi:MAG: hypothetical protein ABIP77_06735 [Candidatus Limnocylindrales bacterium]
MLAAVVYIALGLVWTGRSLLAVIADPQYYDPVTTIDWIAVWTYSLGFILIATAVPLLARDARAGRLLSGLAWVVATAALLAALANGLADGVGIESWGSLYIVGSLTTALGLIAVGAVLWSRKRPTHALVVVLWLAGFAMHTLGLGFLVLVGSIIAINAGRTAAAPA